jgi:hypothetical protein
MRACASTLERLERAWLRGQQVLRPRDLHHLQGLAAGARPLVVPPADPPTPLPDGVVSALQERVDAAEAFVSRREETLARKVYARNLLGGVVLSLLLLGALHAAARAVVSAFAGRPLDAAELLALRDTLVCIGGGAAGAATSVLLRLDARGRHDFEALTGGAARYRIILGWLFSAALLFLVKGGVLDVVTDPTAALLADADPSTAAVISSWFFWGAFGFGAGFNERWAKELLSKNRDAPALDAPTVPREPRQR